MKLKTKKFRFQAGQITLEPLIAISIFTLVINPFIASLINLVSFQVKNRHIAQATQYAREGLEVSYSLAVNRWDYLSGLDMPGTYYPSQETDELLMLDVPYQLAGRYDRSVTVSLALRDGQGNIDEVSGTETDPNTLRIASKVFWEEKGKPMEVELVTYLISFGG